MRTFLRTEWPALSALALSFAFATYAWPRMPETLPVHWGADGQPDRYGSRLEALFLMPMLMTGTYALLLAVERFSDNDRKNAPVLRVARLSIALLAALLVAAQAFGWPMTRTILIGTGLLLALLGNVMGKAQPSAFVGLRTPWTFGSRRAWHRTQRRGAVWLTAYGLLLTLVGTVLPLQIVIPWIAPIGVLAGLFGMTAWLTYASYLDWRADPDPEPALRRQ